jgi:hypothetical protein
MSPLTAQSRLKVIPTLFPPNGINSRGQLSDGNQMPILGLGVYFLVFRRLQSRYLL